MITALTDVMPAVQWLDTWAVVGMSTSCPGKLDLLGTRKGQAISGPSSRPALTHKTNQTHVKVGGRGMVFGTVGSSLHSDPPGSFLVAWSQRLWLHRLEMILQG